MEIIQGIVLLIHILGFTLLFGLCVMQIRKTPRLVKKGMFHGIGTQLITGFILVGLRGKNINHAAAGLKLVVLFVIFVILYFYYKKKGGIIPVAPYYGVLGLTLLEVLIAVLWLGDEA